MDGETDSVRTRFDILNMRLGRRWKSSDTFEEAIEGIAKRIVPVKMGNRNLYVLSTLFDNLSFVGLSNAFKISNRSGGSYLFFNEYNPALPIKFDQESDSYYVKEGFADHPVAGVNWVGARTFCAILGGRLLTEKEWVYLANGGDNEKAYPWGSEAPTESRCNFSEIVGTTTPIFRYPPNCLGFYDMAGNLEEWCSDSRDGSPAEKVVKGGGYNKDEALLRIDSRRYKWGRIGTVGIGFRVCWESMPDLRKHQNVQLSNIGSR